MRWALLVLILLTWGVNVFHLGTLPTLHLDAPTSLRGKWIPKEKAGIHQLVLEGSAFERGLFSGQVTSSLLYRQEQQLQQSLQKAMPWIFQKALFFFSMRWFWGIDAYLEAWMLEEMWGVAQGTSHEFDYLADRYTRQLAYHGIHEVGQTMVDMDPKGFACTVVALQEKGKWRIGRNFDFEAGRIFDEEKIVKWVFPENGIPYVSVIWAGMVGAVTGVNREGVYISINAAGSSDYVRMGIPSTLVVTKALMESKTAKEAVAILSESKLFITDIFVVADKSGELYRVEKSPKKVVVIEEKQPTVITNHLVSKIWEGDKINSYRREKMTSTTRLNRGLERVGEKVTTLPHLLSILREKKGPGGIVYSLGDRRAIDAKIASHSVIWDDPRQILYVSQGPAVSGPFIGFDLEKSFAQKEPVFVTGLPEEIQ